MPQNQKQIKNESKYAVIKQMSYHFSKKGRWFFYKDYLKQVQSNKKFAVPKFFIYLPNKFSFLS